MTIEKSFRRRSSENEILDKHVARVPLVAVPMTFLIILCFSPPTVQGRFFLEEPELQVVQVTGTAPAHPVDTSDQRPVHGCISNFDDHRRKRRKHN